MAEVAARLSPDPCRRSGGGNSDQRLHEDARHLAEATTDLGINLLQETIILLTFVNVLWRTSAGFVFNFNGYSFPLPGYMVCAVLIYAGSASFLTWLVGRDLVGINASRYARKAEAELRITLMRVNQRIDPVTLMHGRVLSTSGLTSRLKMCVRQSGVSCWRQHG